MLFATGCWAWNVPGGVVDSPLAGIATPIGSPTNEPFGDAWAGRGYQPDRRGGEPIGELQVPRQPRQVHQLVGEQQRLDVLARGQADRVAGVVVTVGIPFFHV